MSSQNLKCIIKFEPVGGVVFKYVDLGKEVGEKDTNTGNILKCQILKLYTPTTLLGAVCQYWVIFVFRTVLILYGIDSTRC